MTKINYKEAQDHNYVNGVCGRCGHHSVTLEKSPYTRKGKTIYFGMYPQSEVTDDALKAKLTSLAGTLPTSSDKERWTSYGYYINGSVENFMWYIDIDNAGERYRGVYFTSFRPYFTTGSSSTDNSFQDDNGYYTSTVYWFKYEPIGWKILDESNGKAFLLADIAIDSQEYSPSSNNYADSTIRTWLNETFYNTAFNNLQKELIQTTTVDNSVSSTGYSYNSFVCANTSDKVFLLSYKEVTTYLTSDTECISKSTDYAKSQGCWASVSSVYESNCWWWTRSPGGDGSSYARYIDIDGSVGGDYVDSTGDGVIPALWIAL